MDSTTRHILGAANEKAEQAANLLENKMLIETLEKLENRYLQDWRNSEPHKAEEREIIYRRLAALDEFRKDLASMATSGRVAAYNLRSRAQR